MKKIIFIIALNFYGLNLIAQSSILTIFSEEATPFYLILNGVRQNEYPQTNISVRGLFNENYTAEIVFNNEAISPLKKNYIPVVNAEDRRGEVTYKIKRNNKGKLKLSFFSFTPASQILPPPPNVQVLSYNTTPMPDIVFTETVSTSTTTTTGNIEDDIGIDISIGGIGIDTSIRVNEPGVGTTTTTTTTTTTSGNIETQAGAIYVEEVECNPMDDITFSEALRAINSKSFSVTQLKVAKQVVSSNCLTAKQIKDIAKLFNFEDTKLDFAKYAYPYCYDAENYWQINDVFSFESTIEELDEFIRGR